MQEQRKRLRKGLARLARRRRSVQYVRLSGRALLVGSLALLLFVGLRMFLSEIYGVEVGPRSAVVVLVSGGAAIAALVLAVRLKVFLRPVPALVVAREADRKEGLSDLLSAALAAERAEGPVAVEVIRRAADTAEEIDPEDLYPATLQVAKTLAWLPLALAAVYLLGIPTSGGLVPISKRPGGGAGHSAAAAAANEEPEGERSDQPEEEKPEKDDPAADEPPAKPDQVMVKVVPSKLKYTQREPVTIFVTADPGDPFAEEHTLDAYFVLDEEAMTLRQKVTVKPGKKGGALLVVEAREVPVLGQKLTPGKHKVAAIMKEGDRAFAAEPVEIEIEGDNSGGSPKPKPKPEPQGGAAPPPPEANFNDRFVTPLFNEGEKMKKKGWALVPDPEAPPGSPPRRLPLDQAAREAARRPESAVPTERIRPGDREDVARYFELLRRGR